MQMRSTLHAFLFSGFALTVLGARIADDHGADGLRKIADDTDRNFTSVGKIGLTITNFGTIGTRNSYWPNQPSCEYPLGSRIEHIYQGGVWVGAIPRGNPVQRVTTGAHDRLYTALNPGESTQQPEFASEEDSAMTELSSLSESQYFNERAISHQDFVTWYTDRFTVNPTTGNSIPHHTPLNLKVRQESYAWNFPFADAFVLLSYTLYNNGVDTLDSVYVGYWYEGVVRNTNAVRPGTSGFFGRCGNGYLDTLRMMYTFDYDGVPTPASPADSYVAIKLLGSYPFPRGVDSVGNMRSKTYFNAWRFRSSSSDVAYWSPADDAENIGGARSRFDRMAASMPSDRIPPLRIPQSDNTGVTTLLSTGPYQTLLPHDSMQVVFAVVCGRKFGPDPASRDTRDQRKNLVTNAGFAQQAYDGEDVNGNNVLDPGEDLNGNGVIDHFQLPQPPRTPKVHVEVDNQTAAIYWDKSNAELSIDPITHQSDFEGYRVYRSNAGADFTSPENLLLTLNLVAEFDVPGNTIGYNTGFSQILLSQAKYFPGDSVAYWYRFPPPGANVTHLNGWQYLYGVAAYDRGDSATGIVSLQSKTEIRRVVPGTRATSDAAARVGVYPNPYYVNAVWDGSGERTRKIYFYNLPMHCEIRVYTLAGDVVTSLLHDGATYDGSNTKWFQQFGNSGTSPQFAGGEHAWDLISKYDQAIATGLYLFSVKDTDTGDVKTGKFLVIK
jgi:hypothetical protein